MRKAGRNSGKSFSPVGLERLERRAVMASELTEGNAAIWGAFASDGANVLVSDDSTHVKSGASSIHLRTESGFDTGLKYPANGSANLSLSNQDVLSFWVYSDNRTPFGFQGNQPAIVLKSSSGSYRYEPLDQPLPSQGWAHFFVPLAGSSAWTRTSTGSPNLGAVTSFELHFDTWDYGFDVYVDGLSFERIDANPGPPAPPGVNPNAVSPKVLLYVFDPILENRGGRRTHEVYGWQDPVTLTQDVMADLRTSSHGMVDYRLAETQIVDIHPYYDDGTQLTDQTYVDNWESDPRKWPTGHFDYVRFVQENDLARRVMEGEIDEVWIYASPMGGMWEASMAGQGAFWINGPTQNVPSTRAFPIMGLNYERGVAEALHSYGHRAESTMDHVYGVQSPNLDNNWNKFTYQDRYGQGKGGVGNIHFPVNGQSDYDYDNARFVVSNADDWANYPNFVGTTKSINSREWSPSGIDPHRDYMNWWYSHLPHFAGKGPDGFLNDWWRYVADPDQFKAGTRGQLGGSLGIAKVDLTAPANGANVSGTVRIKADAVTDGALGRVDFYVNGNFAGTDSLAPYTFDWNTDALAGGAYTIEARAYELQRQSEFRSQTITVNVPAGSYGLTVNPGSIPSAPEGSAATLPNALISYGGPVANLSGTLFWGDGTSEKVQLASGPNGWKISNSHVFRQDGTNYGRIEMTDGNRTVSAPFSISVTNVLPQISVTAPTNAFVNQAWTATIQIVDPGSDAWMAQVNFGDDSGIVTLPIDPFTKRLDLSHTFANSGPFVIGITVSDGAGSSLKTQAIDVVVPPDTTPPYVTGFSVTTSNRGRNLGYLTVAFSEPVNSAAASAASTYRLISAGADKKFGTRDDRVLKIGRVQYDPVRRSVKITPGQSVALNQPLRLTVRSTGISDLASNRMRSDSIHDFGTKPRS